MINDILDIFVYPWKIRTTIINYKIYLSNSFNKRCTLNIHRKITIRYDYLLFAHF